MSWTDPEIVIIDEEKKLRLVYLHKLEDTAELGNRMGHCSGGHKFLVQAGLWHFWTVLDEQDAPHLSVHARNVECPSDDELLKRYEELGYKATGDFEMAKQYPGYGYVRYPGCWSSYVPSQRYFHLYDPSAQPPEWAKAYTDPTPPVDDPEPEDKSSAAWYTWRSRHPKVKGAIPFLWKGNPVVLLSCTVRGQLSTRSQYTDLVKKLFDSSKIEDAAPVPLGYSSY